MLRPQRPCLSGLSARRSLQPLARAMPRAVRLGRRSLLVSASAPHREQPPPAKLLERKARAVEKLARVDSPGPEGGDSSSEPRQPTPRRWRQLLASALSPSGVLASFRTLALGLLAGACLFGIRMSLISQARAAPKELLYSDLLQLVDAGRVKAARLEAGSHSKLYFELHPAAQAAAAASPAAAGGAGKAAAKAAGSKAAVPAAAAAAAGAASAAAATRAAPGPPVPALARPAMRRQGFVKLADRHDPLLVSKLLAAGVEFAVVRASMAQQLQHMLLTVAALWVPLLPLLFFAQRLVEQRGSSKRKRASADTPRVTFADVAGCSSAKEELQECVAVLKGAARYSRVRGLRMPSGVLLSGPPGTGKTLLAKAVAGEAGVPFISCAASEFVELFVGRGAARVRELFAEARKLAPCVVFIDELDAVGSKRGGGFNDERDQTLNQLLTELDGFDERPGVLLLAATNRVDVLDAALLRPGRISRRVVVPLPDEDGRAAILRVHLRDVGLDKADREAVARQLALVTPGFSGAQLANVINEALLLTARRSSEDDEGMRLDLATLLEGVRRTRYGVNGSAGRDLGLRQLGRLLGLGGDPGKQVKVAAS